MNYKYRWVRLLLSGALISMLIGSTQVYAQTMGGDGEAGAGGMHTNGFNLMRVQRGHFGQTWRADAPVGLTLEGHGTQVGLIAAIREPLANDAVLNSGVAIVAEGRIGAITVGSETGLVARGKTGLMGTGEEYSGIGVAGYSYGGIGVLGSSRSNTGYGGYFMGNAVVERHLSSGSAGYRIDHPLHPETETLNHAFVGAPEMLNIYSGNVTTDADGLAIVELPPYFEALNRDPRYQLTVIGQFAQAIVAQKVQDNRFMIKTDQPQVEVSWQVTGVRQDAYARQQTTAIEISKTVPNQYLHPDAFEPATQ